MTIHQRVGLLPVKSAGSQTLFGPLLFSGPARPPEELSRIHSRAVASSSMISPAV